MLENPTLWVAVAFIIFFALTFKKLARFLGASLDKHSEQVRAELATAKALREEAEGLLHEYQAKQADYLKEAEAMLAKAKTDAERLSAKAEQDLKDAIAARHAQAEAKIAREEERAVQEVRAHIVDMTLSAARSVIVEQVSQIPKEELLALALADIERKIH